MPYIAERWDSRNGSESAQDGATDLIWIIGGAGDEREATNLALSDAPVYWFLPSGRYIVQQNQAWEIQEGDLYAITISYGPQKPKEAGDFDFSFDTTGYSKKVTQSIKTVKKYAPAGETAPDFQGAINCSDDSVDGVDVQSSGFKWTETHYLPLEAVTFAYTDVLENLTGKRNNASFRGKPADAVIFRGAQGGKKDEKMAVLTFHFESGKHATGLTVGSITGIAKKAWDFLWIRYQEKNDPTNKRLVRVPIAAYVEEVTEAADFSQLGIGTDVPPPPITPPPS